MKSAAYQLAPDGPGVERDARPALEQAIYDAISETDWTTLKGWAALAKIADAVEPDSMMVYPEASIATADKFTVPADLSVVLRYESTPEHAKAEYPDTFPASLSLKRGRDGELTVTDISVAVDRKIE